MMAEGWTGLGVEVIGKRLAEDDGEVELGNESVAMAVFVERPPVIVVALVELLISVTSQTRSGKSHAVMI
jgi:hypothetical protein